MKKILTILFIAVSCFSFSQHKEEGKDPIKESYYQAFAELNDMLSGNIPVNFKRAVFITENAFMDNGLDYEAFSAYIKELSHVCNEVAKSRPLLYDQKDKDKVQKYAAVFYMMTDSIPVLLPDSQFAFHLPFQYDFNDMWGDSAWSNMFVTKLLTTRKGNCHSLPFLYKMLLQEMGEDAWLSFAPNHMYIKLNSKKDGWFNTELTCGKFTTDAWIMASGYIHLSAIQNAIYMDTLSNRQSLAVCMLDLAQGYKRKQTSEWEEFVLQCCNIALHHYPHYINALLLKAETQKKLLDKAMMEQHIGDTQQALKNPQTAPLFKETEELYAKIYELGYRPMPKPMYMNWLMSLKAEKDKYENKNISTFTEPPK